MTDIAAAVGVAAPTIYYHFDNLDAIVEALLRYVVEESAAFALNEAKQPGGARERLHSLLRQHVSRLTSGPYDLWFVVGLSQPDSGRFPTITHHATQWRRAVVRLIERGIADGVFRPIDSRMALAMVTGSVYGALQLRHEFGVVDPDEISDHVLRSIVVNQRTTES